MSCLSCGACCAAFRVDFHNSDLASGEAPGVPQALTVPLTATLVRMRGTDEALPRCVALEGEVGQCVRCTIYEQRPGPCHSGGYAHAEIEAGKVSVDGVVETRKRAKLRPGQTVGYAGESVELVAPPAD